MPDGLSARAAIVGLGASDVGKVYGKTVSQFAADAVLAAVRDAGLELAQVDGVIMSTGRTPMNATPADSLGLKNLRMNMTVASAGATAAAAVQYAAMAVSCGVASTVVYVHADAPLKTPGVSNAASYAAAKPSAETGFGSLDAALGLVGGNPPYALMARRHMEKYGTTTEQFGAVAVGQRAWAAMNPIAQMRDPDHPRGPSKLALDLRPFRLLDCCLVSNGAVAVVVTSAERARDLAQPPPYIWGCGQGHPGYVNYRGSLDGLVSGAAQAGDAAFAMAGIGRDAIGVREFYDCYTFTVLLTLEDYGFVAKGDAGPYAATGALGPSGELPTNTGGGQLSSFYLWGATPLHEGVIQCRGQGGERQVEDHDFVLCSGSGGPRMDHHATLILGAHPRT